MISIRKGMFETNSSSIHALIIDKDTIEPKRIIHMSSDFDEYSAESNDVDGPSYVYFLARERRQTKELFSYLKKCGVEKVLLDGNPMQLVIKTEDDPDFRPLQEIQALVFGDVKTIYVDRDYERDTFDQYDNNQDQYYVLDVNFDA